MILGGLLISSSLGFAQDENDKKIAAPDRAAILAELKLSKDEIDSIEFDANQEAPIFIYGAHGGMGVRPKANGKMEVAEKLKVYTDGKVVVSGRPGMPNAEHKFSEFELIEFLSFVVNKNQFYQLDSKKIENAVAGKKEVKILDAPSTVVIVELKKGRHDVSVYALWNAIKNFPDLESIKRMKAIEDRCSQVMTQVHLGDRGEEVLKLVNEKVAALELGLDPFTLNEIRLATQMAKGRFQVRFTRELPGARAKRIPPSTMHAVYFKKDADTEAVVDFYGLPKKKQLP
jgi:hypothetical protein